ncbi:MAG: hypothetical protein ACTIKH_12880 [Glutamicibacter ardleyensis]|uniref:hypothetical protein n=1 Tax=Glutamicibacter ardleyensis TaxID=225894 RepID=UPI003F9679E0
MNGRVQFHGYHRSERKRRAPNLWDQEPEKVLSNQLREWTSIQVLGGILCGAFVILSFAMGSLVRLEPTQITPAMVLDAVQIRKDTVLAALAILATLIVALALSTRSMATSAHDAREETRRRERLYLSTAVCGSLSVMFGLLYAAGFLANSTSDPEETTDALIIVCLSQTLAYVASTFRLSASEQLSAVRDQLPVLLSKHHCATEASFRRWYFTPRDSIRVPKLVLSLASAILLLIGFIVALVAMPRILLGAYQARYVETVVLLWFMLLLLLVLLACTVSVQWLLPSNRSRLASVVMLVPLGASITFLVILTVTMLGSGEYAGTEKTSAMIIAVLVVSSLCNCLLVLPLALTRYPRSPKLRSAYVALCYPHIFSAMQYWLTRGPYVGKKSAMRNAACRLWSRSPFPNKAKTTVLRR